MKATELEVVHMPFGKYHGRALRSIPKDYMTWFVENVKDKPDIVRSMQIVLAEWGWTSARQMPKKGKPPKARKPKRQHPRKQQPASLVYKTHAGPWPDGWGRPENHEQGGPPPFDVEPDELTKEFREILGVG